jgi:flagellar M-ring protein FliF
METFRRFLAQAREYWSGLGLVRRVGIVAATLGVLVAVGALAYLSPGERYVPLAAAPLPPDEVATMRARLNTENIPNRLTGGGTGLEVPEDRYALATVALAAAGVPARGGKGWELWDENSLMTTPFAQSVNYQRSLQSELARSIMQLEPVQTARVLLARPEPSPFVRDQKQPTASVVLKLKPGAAMSRAAAAGIVSLVARSIEGLQPENVTVVDSAGRLLSDPHAGERDSLPTPQLEYRRELEAYLASKAEAVLNSHLGAGHAVVQVSADLNFQRVKISEKTYAPDGKVARTEMQSTSKTTGGGPRGITGATANLTRAGGSTAAAGGSGTTSQDEKSQTDYAVSETLKDVEDRMGAVTRLTVAALVDLTPPGEGQPVISSADAQEIIKQAVGFRPGRDEVKLTNVRLAGPLGPPEPDETLTKIQRVQAYVSLARNISLASAVVLVVLIGALLLLRRRRAPEPPPTPAAPAAEERRRAELERLLELARTDPDRVAAVFRALIGAPAG